MKQYRPLLYVLLITTLAYSPVISFLFALKNDFFTQYFPQRFFIGEAVTHGIFPLWNPYINYGIPVYADMNGGFWYLPTWVNALFSGYNAYSFTIEAFLHLLASAAGMYWLTGYWKMKTTVRIIAAVSYACSGFNVGQLQHYNWITAAAWLPWCVRAMFDYYNKPKMLTAIPAVLFFTMLLTGAHPGLIIGSIYFFTALTVIHLLQIKNVSGKLHWKSPLLLILLLIIMVSGMAWSYGELIPLFTRVKPIAADEILLNAVDTRSFMSFLLPLTSVRSAYDIALQNVYVGITIFLSAVAGLFYLKQIKAYYFLFISIFFFFLASNLPGAGFATTHLPLLNFVRLNSEFRIFGILALIVFGANCLDHLLAFHPKTLGNILLATASLFLLIVLIHIENVFNLFRHWPQLNNKLAIKEFINGFSFNQAFVVQSPILIVLCTMLFIVLKKKPKWFLHVAVLDLVLAVFLNLPFTGTGMRSVADIQQMIHAAPKSFPMPSIAPERSYADSYPKTDKIIGNWSMYSKNIGVKEWYPYPILLRGSEKYFERDHQQSYENGLPFIYAASAQISITAFTPNLITVQVRQQGDDKLVIKQNLYPGWETSMDDKHVRVDTIYGTFPSIPLQPGIHRVSHEFKKPIIKIWFVVYAAIFSLMLIFMIISSGTFSRTRS